jgi:hypothetical protein
LGARRGADPVARWPVTRWNLSRHDDKEDKIAITFQNGYSSNMA